MKTLLTTIALLASATALHATTYTVTSTSDSGTASLRQAVLDAAGHPGADSIVFDFSLSGQTITLTSEIVITDADGVTIDASALPAGLTIDGGNGTNRIFSVSASKSLTLIRLKLTGGDGTGATQSGDGGAILNLGTLTLTSCTLSGNSTTGSNSGGAVFNAGTLTASGCTFSGNTASTIGGAIANATNGALTLTNCTIAGNTQSASNTQGGGGINHSTSATSLALIHCTVAGNTAHGSDGGGGLRVKGGAVTLRNSILHGNTCPNATTAADLLHDGAIAKAGDNLIGIDAGNTAMTGPAHSSTAPQLDTLGDHGGPVPTMPPLSDSPAIDGVAAGNEAAGVTTDARGAPRLVDGDGNGTALADIGAVEFLPASPLVVQNTSDSGPGSLRDTLLIAAARPGADPITFASALNGGTISLTTYSGSGSDLSAIVIDDAAGVTVDATALANGLTIDDDTGTTYRLFRVTAGSTVTLQGLTLANGGGGGFNGSGGAIYNDHGTLTLSQCTLSGNSASAGGGAIYNDSGTLTLSQCTLSGNSAGSDGGAIYNQSGTLTLSQCTLSGNSAYGAGGAIYNDGGTLTLSQCTLSGNSASAGGGAIDSNTDDVTGTINSSTTLTNCTLTGNTANPGQGGAIRNDNGLTTLTHCTITGNTAPAGQGSGVASFGDNLTETRVQNCIIAGNTNSDVDFYSGTTNSFTSQGGNLIGSGGATAKFNQTNDLAGQTTGTIKLGPLQNNGGPTQTMLPLPGSPAIDRGAVIAGLSTDQRGVSRSIDGDGDRIGLPDSGAAELDVILVTTAADSGTGSLRNALASLANTPIIFDATVFTSAAHTITLTTGEYAVTSTKTIDASSLPAGVTISGNNASRIFSIPIGASLSIANLTLTAGNGVGALTNNRGGAINNAGTLLVDRCTITGNSCTGNGGGIENTGTATVTRSTVASNTTQTVGGGIDNNTITAVLTLTQCTVAANTATGGSGGGGVNNTASASTTLTHCTITGNNASGGAGGGVRRVTGTVTINNSIVALNTATTADTENLSGTINSSTGNNLTSGDPLLAPLGGYGGPTQTMALLPGSPARNTASGSTITSDQRGFPIIGTADIGAYEAGTLSNFNAWIYETLPATATLAQHASTHDYDGDGQTNGDEWIARTNPGSAASYFRITQSTFSGGTFSVTFPTVSGRSYQLQSSPDLADPWTNLGSPSSGTGGNVTLPVILTGQTRYFFRVSVGDP